MQIDKIKYKYIYKVYISSPRWVDMERIYEEKLNE